MYIYRLRTLNKRNQLEKLEAASRDKKGWTQRVGLANVAPKGLYHGIRG